MQNVTGNTPLSENVLAGSKPAGEDHCSRAGFHVQPVTRFPRQSAAGELPQCSKTEMSVLACDIVASTDLAQSVSPEQLQTIVYAYHDYCSELVSAQSGKVARYMGDDCLAFFGAGTMSGEHAIRAVYAAESILRNRPVLELAAGHPLDLRLAVATGIVIEDESRTEQSIVGEPLHLANRLQLVGEENCITVCARTWSQTRDEMDYTASGYRKLKGYTGLVQAWTCRRRT